MKKAATYSEPDLLARAEAAEARLAAALEALEPFAKAGEWPLPWPDDTTWTFVGNVAVTVGDLRRAAQALGRGDGRG